MRNAFAKAMTDLAVENKELVLLSGDMGNRLFDSFKECHPDRFYNCGVAEANMTSVAAGLAMCGLKPVTYSIASFNSLRCFEQIKIDVCYHNLPVIVVGVGAGLSYSELGPTHQSCEDISILRSLPGMTVVCPGDAVEVRLALKAALDLNGPVYLRLGKKNEPVVHETDPDFTIGKAIVLDHGHDICLISTGNVLPVAVEASKLLNVKGYSVSLINMHTVKPLDEKVLKLMFETHSLVSTIEEHSLVGGLGSAVLEWQSEQDGPGTARLCRIGTPDIFLSSPGAQMEARQRNEVGLTAPAIVSACLQKLKR